MQHIRAAPSGQAKGAATRNILKTTTTFFLPQWVGSPPELALSWFLNLYLNAHKNKTYLASPSRDSRLGDELQAASPPVSAT
jgi:hypothetical protein